MFNQKLIFDVSEYVHKYEQIKYKTAIDINIKLKFHSDEYWIQAPIYTTTKLQKTKCQIPQQDRSRPSGLPLYLWTLDATVLS